MPITPDKAEKKRLLNKKKKLEKQIKRLEKLRNNFIKNIDYIFKQIDDKLVEIDFNDIYYDSNIIEDLKLVAGKFWWLKYPDIQIPNDKNYKLLFEEFILPKYRENGWVCTVLQYQPNPYESKFRIEFLPKKNAPLYRGDVPVMTNPPEPP